ncbi:MAG TPA: MBL fold metallo-hydrolase [Vicinamibacterales bacterium]|nr:MBL fold metallo-hydrolase [Vicinamibacterales bacterium]
MTPAVRVRMYRQGLGDCFLVTFDVGANEGHLLIDCGSLGATTTGVSLADVLKNIRETTGGHLDVVMATHEHQDHVSAFRTQRAAFQALHVDQVWLAWTENPQDPEAQAIAKRRDDLGEALVQASRALTRPEASPASRAVGLAVHDVLGFGGDPDAAGAFAETINEAMSFVRTGLTNRPRYLKPGEPAIEEPWCSGFRIYVLGPPSTEAALEDVGEAGSSELYGVAGGLGTGAAFLASGQTATAYLAAAELDQRAAFQAAQPFDSRFRVERESARAGAVYPQYLSEADWRRVDDDWMHMAGDLALQLDSATNNTSLAIAIERIADGKVLLFPADAQEGNWLSWHDPAITWTIRNGDRDQTVTAATLLSRAVFYKVGHHGSHNGTAKGRGLELMEQQHELTAFVPVDRAVALNRNPKKSWRMPAVALYRALLPKCQGRIVRSDIGWADDAAVAANVAVEEELQGIASPPQWTEWRAKQRAATNVTVTPLFVDYLLP